MFIPFDILYEGFCNKIRSSGKSETILQLIKRENSDKFRVKALLEEEPELYSLLARNISESYEKKDDQVAIKLWKRGTEGKSLELLTEAFCHCPIPQNFEEKVVTALDTSEKCKALLQSFIGSPMREKVSSDSPSDSTTLAGILYDRACVLFSRKRYISAYIDFMRAWLLGFCKTLEMTYQVAVCCFEDCELDIAKELLQCCAQHLRTLPMTNDVKSEWTMNIVTVLKAIESVRKYRPNAATQTKSTIMNLSATPENSDMGTFTTLFSGESEQVIGSSSTIELKFSMEKGRHMIASQNIPPGKDLISYKSL